MRDGAKDGAVVRSGASGYVQVIHLEHLTSEAARADTAVSLFFRPGQFVREGDVLALVLPAQCFDAMTPIVIVATQLGWHRNLD